ncbi:MAG: sensor histidine kinase YesM [Flavobacteriaceae bacterium]|jgi:sensor histidine kinase YesM
MENRLINTNNKISFKYHLIFWVSYFLINVIRWGSYYEDYLYSFKSNIVTVSMSMALAYLHVYVLLPRFVFQKKIVSYVFFLLISLTIFYVVRTELIFTFINENVWPESQTPQRPYAFNHILAVILIGIYDVALATTIKLAADWIYERKRNENLEAIQLQTELQFLKAQIQPHFFFNTLNNLYALILEKSKAAPEVVLKLSEIMEYILYEAKEPKIRLFNEIKYVQNYIDLERLRYGDRVTVETTISGDIENAKVPPLLFLPFIENCFKHGTRENNFMSVKINFEKLENSTIKFSVSNNYNQFSNKVKEHGIGNKNVERRLQLLFKDKYVLEVTSKKQQFLVTLIFPTT